MPATIAQIMNEVGPLWVIDQRLSYHTASAGRRLFGLKYDREGKLDPYGSDGLPYVRVLTVSTSESITAGGTLVHSGSHFDISHTLMLLISAKREYGLFQRDPTVDLASKDSRHSGIGILQWVARVKDALECKAAPTQIVDTLLEGVLMSPVKMSVREAPITDLAWSVILELNMVVRQMYPAGRSATS